MQEQMTAQDKELTVEGTPEAIAAKDGEAEAHAPTHPQRSAVPKPSPLASPAPQQRSASPPPLREMIQMNPLRSMNKNSPSLEPDGLEEFT